MIEIDGSFGFGQGQILRTTCALSAATKKPCRIFNIQNSGPKPGLIPQHLLEIQSLAQISGGRLEGDKLGSKEIKFYPGKTYRDRVSVNIPTAGSITLILQILIPPCLSAPGPIKISFDGGATDTFFSPTIDYFRYVFLKTIEKMGAKVEINILKRGYHPEGGAKAEIKIFPSKLKPINLIKRGCLKKILAISGTSSFLKNPEGVAWRPYGAGKKVAERQLIGVREILGKLKLPIEEKIEYYDTLCPGSQICLIADFALRQAQGNAEHGRSIENTVIGTDNLGKLGKRAEDVGKEAALELLREQKSEACLDKHLADQILIYMALAEDKSQITVSEITNHCKDNIWIIEKFLDGKFEIKDNLISWIPKKS